MMNPQEADIVVQEQLDYRSDQIGSILSSDVMSFDGPLISGVEDLVRRGVEHIRDSSDRKKLVVVLTTMGGYIEPVQRIVEIFRHHYEVVEFIVPNHAYSAGTILTMSGDAIYMNYFSRLGPIDPQVENANGQMVPALGYLEQWKRLTKKAERGSLNMAEIQVMIYGFDQAELYKYEQERELSIDLLKTWLVRYKFKDWTTTESRQMPVTEKMKRKRAADIAKQLNNTGRWHSHGQGIPMKTLKEELKLLIEDFDDNNTLPELGNAVKDYYNLLSDYVLKQTIFGKHTCQGWLPAIWEG